MNQQIAIIDLGTNTCNLLIADYSRIKFKIRYQWKEVVKLGKSGMDNNLLTQDGLERTILAISKHLARIRKYYPQEIVIIATSAIREAANRDWFAQEVKARTGLELQIVSGEKEADLIFKGVKLAFGKIDDHSLILDIGGGSNEFILTESGIPVWKESFPLGMARIIEQIPPSDPITGEEIRLMQYWFESRLETLWTRLQHIDISMLIGCSGAFDTVADLIDQTDAGTQTRIRQEIKMNDFYRIYEQLVSSTTAQRMKMKGMESIRIEMIVPSVIFIKMILERLNIRQIYQTDFALREGVLYERIFH
ncbi:MAG TPA: phosphatase [Prolixibacteraceae bacterium]|jgi:exopolyphosphatase/guanosine-5'-triphosphate,3'-diphosphate pyrophosphatase|nr:phosphatase [Prolixibacteraceae bacterium]